MPKGLAVVPGKVVKKIIKLNDDGVWGSLKCGDGCSTNVLV